MAFPSLFSKLSRCLLWNLEATVTFPVWSGCACTSCNPCPAATSDHHSIFVCGKKEKKPPAAAPYWVSWRPRVAVFCAHVCPCVATAVLFQIHFVVFWTSWFFRYTWHHVRKFTRKITLVRKYTLDKRADKAVPPLTMKLSDPCRGHPLETGWCQTVTLKAGSNTSACSPPVTFLMSRCFTQGAVTHLLGTRTTEHKDLVRRAVPGRERKNRSPIPTFLKSRFSEKYAIIISVRERTVWHCPSLSKDKFFFFLNANTKGTFLLWIKINFKIAFIANSLNVLLHFPAIILPLTRHLLISILPYFMCVSVCVLLTSPT